MISDTEWPHYGRVGLCQSGEHMGEYVLLVSENRDEWWTLYIAEPRADESFDNYLQGNNVAEDIITRWLIEWVEDTEEDVRLEQELFSVRRDWPRPS